MFLKHRIHHGPATSFAVKCVTLCNFVSTAWHAPLCSWGPLWVRPLGLLLSLRLQLVGAVSLARAALTAKLEQIHSGHLKESLAPPQCRAMHQLFLAMCSCDLPSPLFQANNSAVSFNMLQLFANCLIGFAWSSPCSLAGSESGFHLRSGQKLRRAMPLWWNRAAKRVAISKKHQPSLRSIGVQG